MKKTICNKCGREFGDVTQDYNENFSIHTQIGFGSKYDRCGLELDLCSDCMDELIDSCVISPVIDYDAQWAQEQVARKGETAQGEDELYGF